MLGKAAVAMWWDVPPEVKAEWEDWHTREHMPERLGIPGFLRGSRWIARSGRLSYFVLYETSSLAVLKTGAYLRRLDNPTPWSRKLMPHHRNMVRSLCRAHASYGGGLSRVLGTLRVRQPVPRSRLSALPERRGLTSACLLQSTALPRQTTEQKIRGGDAQADWIVLVGGHDAGAVEKALRQLRTRGAVAGVYVLSHSLSARE